MEGFAVKTIDLSMLSPETGRVMTANVYEVEGIDRQLSIGELVMAVCLSRAAELEEEIIQQMEDMSNVTTKLESLTKVQEALTGKDVTTLGAIEPFTPVIYCEWPGYDNPFAVSSGATLVEFLTKCAGLDINANTSVEDAIANISSSQDSLNSVNQKQMIELQSKTNKRDQSYDLITNMIKSIGTVLTATTNNYSR